MRKERSLAFAGEHYGNLEIDVKHEIGFEGALRIRLERRRSGGIPARPKFRTKNPQRGTRFL